MKITCFVGFMDARIHTNDAHTKGFDADKVVCAV